MVPVPDPSERRNDFVATFTDLLQGPVEGAYDSAFIKACAQALDSEVWEAKKRFKLAWGHDFHVPHFAALVREAREQIGAPDEERYILTSAGTMRAVVANAITMLGEMPVRYNMLSERPELTGPPPWGGERLEWSDDQDTRAAEWCQHHGLHVNSNMVAEAIQTVSRSRAYHPVQNKLNACEWDRQPRLGRWLTTYAGADDSELTHEIGSRWMISAVARAFQPGCQADYTLVLEGVEGIRKSSALRALGDPWFTDDIGNISDGHRAAEGLQGHWIVEIKELSAFRRTEWIQIKAWLDRRQDKFRPAYGRRLATYQRQNVFSASTNKRQWIEDDTGARRFWAIWCKKLDVDALYRDASQLWAEATHLYKDGEQWYLLEEFNAEATKEQTKRRFTDPWMGIVRAWCDYPLGGGQGLASHRDRIIVGEVLEYCVKLPPGQWKPSEGHRVESCLRLLGYQRTEEGVYEREA